MEIKEIRKMSSEDIKKEITKKKEELFSKRMLASSGSLEKPVELRILRRDIAKMKTVLKEREMDGEK